MLRKKQSGVMLLEALIGILIFSLGVLALVGLQAVSIKLSGDAKYRANAALVANKLFSEMRMSRLNIADLRTQYQTDGAAYNLWVTNDVQRVLAGLADLDPANGRRPTVVVEDTAGVNQGQATVTIFWRSSQNESTFHQYTTTTQVRP